MTRRRLGGRSHNDHSIFIYPRHIIIYDYNHHRHRQHGHRPIVEKRTHSMIDIIISAWLSTLREADGLSHDKRDRGIIIIIIIILVLVVVVKTRRTSSSINYDYHRKRPYLAIPSTIRVLILPVVVLPQMRPPNRTRRRINTGRPNRIRLPKHSMNSGRDR